MVLRSLLRASVVTAAVLSTRGPARADALPPDQDCPSGEVWVRGHSGGCRKVAPTDCAAGWVGVIGGQCVVAVVSSGATCDAATEPRAVTLCLEKRLDRGNGRVLYEPPREYAAPVGILGPGLACEGEGRRAEAGTVCVAPGESPTPFIATGERVDGPRAPTKRGACSGGDADGGLALALGALVTAALARSRRRRVAR